MGGMGDPDDNLGNAIKAVTSAIENALTVLRGADDPLSAFMRATELWAELRRATDDNGRVRAVLAAQVANAHPDDTLEKVAEILSTDAHRVKKARAGELIQLGRAILDSHRA